WHSSTVGLSPDALFAAMRGEEALFAQIPHAELFASTTPFQLLVPLGPRVQSLPPPSLRPPPPTPEDGEARADALVAAGEPAAALVEYGKTLAQLGPTITESQPRIYLKVATTLLGVGRESDALAYFEAVLDHKPEQPAALRGAAELKLKSGDQGG